MEDTTDIELSGPVLQHLSDMICGNDPYRPIFPYRSSKYLTRFFADLFLDYQHDGSTRDTWVRWALADISDERPDPGGHERYFLNEDLARVILHIVNPLHFQGEGALPEAFDQLDQVLRQAGLALRWDEATESARLIQPSGGALALTDDRTLMVDALVVRPRVFSPPQTRENNPPLVSAMMPYGDPFDWIYEDHLRPTVEGAGFQCRRADEAWEADVVIEDIVHLIHNSVAVIVDLTGKNPNVFYELGITHTLGKPVLLISQDGGDLPFNIQHHRCIEYTAEPAGLDLLCNDLSKRLGLL